MVHLGPSHPIIAPAWHSFHHHLTSPKLLQHSFLPCCQGCVGPRLFSPAFQWMHPIDHMDVVWSIFQSPNVGNLAFLGAVLSLPCGKCREDHIILPPVHIVVLEQTHDPRSC